MKLVFVGGGNMAHAMLGGLRDSGFDPHDLQVLEPDAARRTDLEGRFGVTTHGSAGAWLAAAEIVVLAVKPQQMREAVRALIGHVARPLVLSIAAGVRGGTLARWLGHDRIVRAMPNTPALIRAGITGAVALPGVSDAQRADADRVLRSVGEVIWLDDEAMLDPVTAVSGSGPAYVFYFIEALQAAATELGFTDDQARRLATQTFLGAARLAAESADPAAVLRERVTSKGGTTAAALERLESAAVREAIVAAVRAAARRGTELGDTFDTD